MGEYVTELNSRVYRLRRDIAEREYKKALIDSSKVNERLYDLGYIHSPLCFSFDEVLNAVFEEYGAEFLTPYTHELSGVVDFSPLRCDYVCDNYDGELYTLIRDGMKANDTIELINSWKINSGSKVNAKVFNLRGTVSSYGGVHILKGDNILSPYLLSLCAESDSRVSFEVDFSHYILDYIFERILGTERGEILRDQMQDKKYFQLLITGSIKSNTKSGLELYNLLEQHNRQYGGLMKSKTFLESISEDLNNYLREHIQPYGEGLFFGLTDTAVVYTRPLFRRRSYLGDLHVGRDLYDIDTKEQLDVINRLRGISGAFKSTHSIVMSGYAVNTMPIRLDNVQEDAVYSTNYYHAMEITDRSGKYVYRHEPYEKSYLNEEEVLKKLELSRLEDLAPEVTGLLSDVTGYYAAEKRKLIGALVQTLVCIDCDHVPEGAESSNDVLIDFDYRYLSDEDIEEARYYARSIYMNLGIQ